MRQWFGTLHGTVDLRTAADQGPLTDYRDEVRSTLSKHDIIGAGPVPVVNQ